MPNYAYTALSRDGKKVSSREFASDRKTLEGSLKRRHLVLQDCRELRTRSIGLKATVAVISQLAQLVGSGIVIERALQVIGEDAENKQVAYLADRLRQGVKRGQPVSQALQEIGRFDPLLVPLLRAGEASGRMAEILGTLEGHYEQRQKMRRTIIGSLAYPAVLIAANILSLTGLGLYVIPVFKGLFEDRMDSLAASTRIVFRLSDLMLAHGLALIAVVVAVVTGSVLAVKASSKLRYALDSLLLRVPLLGAFLGKVAAVNVMSVLGLMLNNGVPLAQALELACEAVSNQPIRRALREALKDLRRGRRFGVVIRAVPGFPKSVYRFVAVGEETGNLGDMCIKAARLLQDECDAEMGAMVIMLEPVLILVMGGIVAFVVVSMLLAVYSMSDIK